MYVLYISAISTVNKWYDSHIAFRYEFEECICTGISVKKSRLK